MSKGCYSNSCTLQYDKYDNNFQYDIYIITNIIFFLFLYCKRVKRVLGRIGSFIKCFSIVHISVDLFQLTKFRSIKILCFQIVYTICSHYLLLQ